MFEQFPIENPKGKISENDVEFPSEKSLIEQSDATEENEIETKENIIEQAQKERANLLARIFEKEITFYLPGISIGKFIYDAFKKEGLDKRERFAYIAIAIISAAGYAYSIADAETGKNIGMLATAMSLSEFGSEMFQKGYMATQETPEKISNLIRKTINFFKDKKKLVETAQEDLTQQLAA